MRPEGSAVEQLIVTQQDAGSNPAQVVLVELFFSTSLTYAESGRAWFYHR